MKRKITKHVPIATILVIVAFLVGLVLGFTINVDKQVEKEVNIRLERVVDIE